MNIIQGTLTVNGRPRNGVTAKLWRAEAFSSPPEQGDSLPDEKYEVGSTVTGPDHGSDGAYRFVGVDDAVYYVSLEVGGTIAWEGHSVSKGAVSYKLQTQGHEYGLCRAGQTFTICHVRGSGVLRQLFFALTSEEKEVVEDDTVIKVFINRQGTPAIQCPISQFFAYTFEAEPFWTQRFAVTRKDYKPGDSEFSRGAYRYLDIPFDEEIRVELDVSDAADLRLWSLAYYQETDVAEDRGRERYLRGDYYENESVPAFSAVDLLDITGRGRLDTLVLSGENSEDIAVLEGNLEIYVDGEEVPSFYVTGTEDITGNAFYFGPDQITGPYQGAPVHDVGPPAKWTQYRIFDLDKLDFDQSLKIRWYAGHKGQGSAFTADSWIRATTFYYLDEQPDPPGDLTFETLIDEKFDSYGDGNDIGSPWVQNSGVTPWRQESVGAVYDDTDEFDAWMYHGDSDSQADYVVEADVKINNFATGEVFVFARGSDDPHFGNRISFGLSSNGAEVEHENYQPVFLFVADFAGSESSLLLLKKDVLYTIRLEVFGGQVICSIKAASDDNEREVFRHFQNDRNEGYAGLSVASGDVEVHAFRQLRRL
ncbi:MAG: DUF2961 domain-containing protein [Chloroflexota bacterium]